MAIKPVLVALAVALTPVVAAVAEPTDWHRYAIRETGAASRMQSSQRMQVNQRKDMGGAF